MDVPSNQGSAPSESVNIADIKVEAPSESVDTADTKVEAPSVQVTGNDKATISEKWTARLQIAMQSLPVWVILLLALFCKGEANPDEICENLLAMFIIDLGTMTSAQGVGLYGGNNTMPILDSTLATFLLLVSAVFYMILRLDSLVTFTFFFHLVVIVGISVYYVYRVNVTVGRE